MFVSTGNAETKQIYNFLKSIYYQFINKTSMRKFKTILHEIAIFILYFIIVFIILYGLFIFIFY